MVRFRIIRASDFLRTTVSGHLDLAKSKRILHRIADTSEEGPQNILLDTRPLQEHLGYVEIYKLVEELKTRAEAFQGKIAVLNSYENQYERTQFLEAAATFSGFNLRAFPDFEEAVTWLHDDEVAEDDILDGEADGDVDGNPEGGA